jgi:hypothetical protein
MALAHVYATVDPKSLDRLLVKVLDEAGNDLPVSAKDLAVTLWASAWTGELTVPVPITSVDTVGDFAPGFHEVRLGKVGVADVEIGGQPRPVASLTPTVYAISFSLHLEEYQHGAAIVRT